MDELTTKDLNVQPPNITLCPYPATQNIDSCSYAAMCGGMWRHCLAKERYGGYVEPVGSK